MKAIKFKKLLSFILAFVFMFGILAPTKIKAASSKVNSVIELELAYNTAQDGDVITLSNTFIPGDVTLNKNDSNVIIDGNNKTWNTGSIKVQGNGKGNLVIKDIIMDGNGFTKTPITNLSKEGELVLENIKITDSKQGAFYISTGGISKTELNRVYVSESSSPVISIGEGSTSEIEINNSTIENNIGEGGGSISGAISSKFYLGNLDINNSIFRNNTNNSVHTGVIGGGGGAMSMHYLRGTVNIKNSIFDENQSSGEERETEVKNTYDGGALYIFDGRDGAEVNIEGTTFSNNIAFDDGGAIMFQGTGNPGLTTNIINSTFFNNKAYGLD